MSTVLQIPKQRVGNDVNISVRLTDSGVKISWKTVEDLRVKFYSDKQGILAGDCRFAPDPKDDTLLNVTYPAAEPQYLGINKLVLACSLKGMHKTYDKPVIVFVDSSDAEGVAEVTVPVVELESGDISSDLICAILNDCLTATEASKAQVETATSKMETIVSRSETAIAEAESATANAVRATGEAQAATEESIRATGDAREATTQSITATGNAETATTNAIEATRLAKEMTDAASLATQNANEATQNSIDATVDSRNATTDSREATRDSRTATGEAIVQTGHAKTQGDYAKAQGDQAKREATNARMVADSVEGRVKAAEVKVANNVAWFENRDGKVVMVLDDDNMNFRSGVIREDGRVVATYN